MSIATWLKQRNARDREKLIEEGYELGYDDAKNGRPRRMGAGARPADRTYNHLGRHHRRRPLQ